MELVNLTPHDLNIVCHDGHILTIPPSGDVARVETVTAWCHPINEMTDDIPVSRVSLGRIVGLPEPRFNHVFIVSLIVAQAAQRLDVYSPGELIRDADGKPIGCKGLHRHVTVPDGDETDPYVVALQMEAKATAATGADHYRREVGWAMDDAQPVRAYRVASRMDERVFRERLVARTKQSDDGRAFLKAVEDRLGIVHEDMATEKMRRARED